MGQEEEKEQDLPEFDGTRPQEDVSAEECEGSPKRSEFQPHELAGGVEESEFAAGDEIQESFPIDPIPVIMGADGIAEIVTPDYEDALAVPFCYETQLCIEDKREYVELFAEELQLQALGWDFKNSHLREGGLEVSRWSAPDAMLGSGLERGMVCSLVVRSQFNKKDGSLVERNTFHPDCVVSRWGASFVEYEDDLLVPVRPRRERCKFYHRQVFSNDNQKDMTKPGHQIVFRVCTARRSNGGAYMSLRDEAIYACDFRDPPDPNSAQLQDDKDLKKLQERPDLLLLPMFNLDGEVVQLERPSDVDDQ